MKLEALEVVPELVSNGVWWDLELSAACEPRNRPHPTHGCMLVVPFGDEYQRALAEAKLEHAAAIRAAKGKVPDELTDEIRGKALGKAVLKGLANVELCGRPVEFSEELAVELMTRPKWKHLRDRVEAAAGNEAALRVQEEREAAGN